MLSAYRRHLSDCPHRQKGQHYTLCDCPIWCYGRRLHGDPIRRSLGTCDWKRAEQRIEILEKGGDGDAFFGSDSSVSVAAAVKQFLAACSRRNLRASTLRSYAKTLEHLTEAIGSMPTRTVGVPVMDRFAVGRKVKPRTWGKELETLRAFFAWCFDRGWIADNPAKRLKMPRTDEPATLPFTEDELQALIGACDSITTDNPGEVLYVRQRARALIYVLIYSGLRISDVTVLRRAQIDWATRHVSLKVMKTGVMQKLLLHPDAIAALKALPAIHPEYFFWGGSGNPVTCTKNLGRTIRRLGLIAKIHAHPHRFRDTFAVQLLANGSDIRTVQLLLGHQSVKTTEKHYAHFVAAHQVLLDNAAATLDFRPKNARPVLMKAVKHGRRNA